MSPILQISNWSGTFFAVSYSIALPREISLLYLTFYLELLHLYIHLLLCLQISMGIYILRFYPDCHWLLGKFDLKDEMKD